MTETPSSITSLMDVFSTPSEASIESIFECWTSLQREGATPFPFEHGRTVWHVLASWSDFDWMKMELSVRRLTQNAFAFESWLHSLYSLNDEFVSDARGSTPMDLASRNSEWPYLLDWWTFRRQSLEHAQLKERHPLGQFRLDSRIQAL